MHTISIAETQQLYESPMYYDERVSLVARLISAYVQSPSLTHLRHPTSVKGIAQEIVKALTDRDPLHTKWTPTRETLAKRAALCWVPPDELLMELNALEGPPLTKTDLEQRIKDFVRSYEFGDPDESYKTQCREMYEKEKADGTEFFAIVNAIAEWVDEADSNRFKEQWAERDRQRAEAKEAKEKLLLSGADCTWTSITDSKTRWCRIDGRTFRAKPTDLPTSSKHGKMLELSRVSSTSEDEPGTLIGTYETLRLATEIARQLIANRDPRVT